MAVQINTYAGILSGVLAWMGRDAAGETIITSRFDDILALCERRMYYGFATEMDNPLRSDPLRIPEMYTSDAVFTPGSSGTVAQPANFLELISVYKNTSSPGPVQIVAERIIDGYHGQTAGGCKMVAVSGQNFRFYDAPTATDTFTLRSYQKLTTPAGSTANAILTNYPDVYLYGCLVEAAIRTADQNGAQAYLSLYNASVSGLNARRQRITASANPIIRIRAGMAP